jgi:hypothetical protein
MFLRIRLRGADTKKQAVKLDWFLPTLVAQTGTREWKPCARSRLSVASVGGCVDFDATPLGEEEPCLDLPVRRRAA